MVELPTKLYQIWIPGEPVAKSTKRPPRGAKAYWVVQNDPKYKRLKDTWAYQRHVSECALADGCIKFNADDPIQLSAVIRKSGHKTGDTKNIIAAIEDGLQWGKYIPNDRQITSYSEINVFFGAGKDSVGVLVALQIDPRVRDFEWLTGWLQSKKKAKEYQEGCYGKG